MSSEKDKERHLLSKIFPTVKTILQSYNKMSANKADSSHNSSHSGSHTVGRKSHTRGKYWAHPGHSDNRLQLQYFHLQVPECARDPGKQPLQQSLSAPFRSTTQSFSGFEAVRRPLPLIPNTGRGKQIKKSFSFKHQHNTPSQQEDRIGWIKYLVRRKTVAVLPQQKQESEEDHIYEEIDKDCDDKDTEDNSFLSLISSERRKNLQFYGCTGWDFGPDM